MANRVVLGEFGGDYVLRVSRPGFNVLDPSLPRHHLAFDSRWPENLNIATSGNFVYSGLTYDIPHGMSYSTGPVVFAWFENGGYIYQVDSVGPRLAVNQNEVNINLTVTTTVVRFAANFSGANINYLILRNSNG